jgi:CHAT domain-containing protein
MRPVRQSALRFTMSVAFVATLVAGIATAPLARRHLREFSYRRRLGLTDVVSAASRAPYRRVAPRLSADFPWRPLDRNAQSARETLNAAATVLNDKTTKGADALQGSGIAFLVLADPVAAQASLERSAVARTGAPTGRSALARLNDPSLLSDLCAVYYERGVREQRTRLILEALELGVRSSERQPASRAAAFNVALCTEEVHEPAQAISAWQEYLALDSDTNWAAEARSRIDRLKRQLNSRRTASVEELTERIEVDLLPRWGSAYASGRNADAENALRESEFIAAQLERQHVGRVQTGEVRAVRAALTRSAQVASRLAKAHAEYGEARTLFATGQPERSLPLFERARDSFLGERLEFALRPWRYVAGCHIFKDDTARSIREVNAALDYCRTVRCAPPALGHIQWIEAFAAGRQGQFHKAVSIYQSALKSFTDGGEYENAGSIHARIAENLAMLNVTDDAWPHLMKAMQTARADGSLYRIKLAFEAAADAAQRQGYLKSARLYQDVVVEAARREHDLVTLADALLWRARIPQADSVAVHRDLQEARSLAERAPDLHQRDRLMANIAVARSASEAPEARIRSLTSALEYFAKSDDHYWLADLYAARAAAQGEAGRPESEAADWATSIVELNRLRERIDAAPVRERFFSQGSITFDRLIRHLWTHGRRAEAFAVAEQSRGRELNGGAGTPSASLTDIAAFLHKGETLVEFAFLEDRTAVWIIRDSGVQAIELGTSAAEFEGAVDVMLERLARREEFDQVLRPVADLIYAPIADSLSGDGRLIVVANKSMRAVPLAALREPKTGKYLVEQREIVAAPSAGAWLQSVKRDRRLRSEPQRVLLASYAGGDETRRLPPLYAADREIQRLTAIYGRSVTTLTGAQATPVHLLQAAAKASIVHIAAHAVQNTQHPEYSAIVLAGDLTARDVGAASLRRTRFVFLSTCGTSGSAVENDPPMTLLESFLGAGVPTVIGSLREVDDEAAFSFAETLHLEYAATGDAVTALRRAQLHCISSPEWGNPRFWSSWIAIGGTS